MLPSQALQNFNQNGHTHQGLVDDISTRSLQSVRVGEGAGKIGTGIGNALVGYEAGKFQQDASFGTFVGYQAGYQNLSASYGTFVGAYAGAFNERGEENVFVGYRTGEQNTSGSECVGVGAYAMRYNASGNYSVSVGYAAGERCIDGSFNTMIGAQSGQDNRSGSYNTMAGYRSGRSAFQGNYNTYFGAYAGYSNYHGDANCFIGYRSGESLSDGSYNIAIGAYSLAFASQGDSNISIGPFAALFSTGSGNIYFGQNAGASNYTGDFNIIIGVDAGLSNVGSKNVIIGESSAPVWKGDCNVLIGAEVAKLGSGFQSVIIGYQAASTNYQSGTNNIFIGDGSDSTRSNVNSAISIGTYNVTTTSDSIAVGKNIENTGINSVSVGFDIQTNAQNSVLVGETLTITSATYFNDPLNIEIVAVIQSDAYLKFGISNILYSNGVLGTIEEPFATAEFGYQTSNTYATTTNPTKYRTSPNRYNLSDQMGYYSLVTGCNLFYTTSSCNSSATFNQTLTELTASNIYINGYPMSLSNLTIPVITAASNNPLISYASNETHLYSSIVFGNLGIGTTFVLNVFSVNQYSNVYPLNILKKHIYPSLSNASTANPILVYPNPSDGIYLNPFESNVIVIEPPRYGVLDTCINVHPSSQSPLTVPSYTLTTPQLFASNDSMTLLSSVYYYDAASNLIGISSNASGNSTHSISISDVQRPFALTPRPYSSVVPVPFTNVTLPLTSNEIVFTQYGQWGRSSNLVFAGFDSAFVFYDGQSQTTYTCNQALHIPQFNTSTVTYPVDVNTNTSNFEFVGSNQPFYIGNTYVFQQYAPSNVSLQLRFASAADGAGGTDYIDNVSFVGTPGIDGTSTILITSNTPNPLYYYASNQIGYGGSNDIFAIPTAPLSIPYASVLAGSNAFIWTDSNITSNYEPFRFTIGACNIQIPFITYRTTGGLWQDTTPTFSSNYTLLQPGSVFYGTSKYYSNIYVEQYPSYGRLRWSSSPILTSNTSNIGYQPLELWEERTDRIQFLLGNTTDASYKRYTWSPHTTPGYYQSSNYWIQTPIQTAFVSSNVAQIFLSYSSNVIYHQTVYTSNIISATGATTTLPTRTVYTPITSYDSTTIGQMSITSNEIQQSNLAIISGTFGSNQYVRILQTSNIDISFTDTSNIQFSSNVLSVQYDGTYTDPYSVLTVNYYQTNTTRHRRLYNSNYTVFRQWDDRSNVYDSTRNTYLFHYSNTYPIATSNLQSSNELPNTASSLIYTYSNTDIQRLFREDRTFYPITRTALYQSNAVFVTLPNSYYHAIESNVGVVAYFHSSNIPLNKVYLEPVTPTPSGAINQRYDYTITTVSGAPGVPSTPQSVLVPYFTSNTQISIHSLPDYKNRTGDRWLEMDSNYQAPLASWEPYIRPTLSFTPTHIYITNVQRGSILQPTTGQFIHRFALSTDLSITNAVYQASGHYDMDQFEFFYANETTGQVSTVYLQSVFIRFSPALAGFIAPNIPSSYAVSSRPAHWNAFTSNAFFLTAPEQTYTNLYYRFDVKNVGDPLDFYQWPSKTTLSLGILSWSNVADASVYMTVKNTIPSILTSNTLSYTMYGSYANASAGINAIEVGSYTFPVVPFYDFPQASEMSGTLESIRYLGLPHSNVLHGTTSNLLANYVNYEGDFQNSAMRFLQTRSMPGGFLSNAYFVQSNIVQNEISYYPYVPSSVSNESLYFRWLYSNGTTFASLVASPEYTISYKNYWFLSGSQPITPQRTFENTRLVSYDDRRRFILSDGFVADRGPEASNVHLSPSNYTYDYDSNLRTSNLQTVTLVTPGVTLASSIRFIPVAYSYPPVILTSSVTLSVEQAGDVSLSGLVASNVIAWDSNNANDLVMYIDAPPANGILLNSNLSSWRYSELVQDRVRYQHLGGGDTSLTDTFSVRFATHDYNVTTTPLTVNIVVEPLPRLIDHRRDAIYALTSNEALQTHYSLNHSMTFTSPSLPASPGYIHIMASSNIYTELAGSPCNVLPLALMGQGSNTYRFQSNYFEQPFNETGVTGIYDPLYLKFALRARSNAQDVHRLTYEPMYSNMIVHSWFGDLNQFVSSNTIVAPFLASNEQRIEYQMDVRSSNYPPMALQETSFSFYTQPNSTFLPMNSNALELFDPYLDFAFRVEFQDSNAADICSFQISRSAITVFSNTYPIPPSLKSTIDFNSYTYWSFVFNDSANESALSLYINPNTSLPNKENQTYNLFKDVSLTPSLSNLATIRIVSEANDSKNYYANHTSNLYWPVSSGAGAVYSHVNLSNYDHRLYFKNVELSTKYPTNQASDILTDTYNIALGKNIQIRGEDNICFGTNFSTLGKFSIIIGNNIGQSANFVNQVYESIIIGNTSFQGSIIRNVIAIGSALMNDLYAGARPGLTDQVINQFISKKPILIGNSIGPEKVDYHVNVANTFMRTSVGNSSNLDQIYLGNDNEIVAIGYTSNAHLQGPADLFVNGDIQVDAIQYHFSEAPLFGTATTPINGGSFVIDADNTSRVIFELASNISGSPAPLNVQFSNFSRHLGKELDIVFNERSSVSRALTLGTNVRFSVPRPSQTTPGGIDRLQCWIVQSNLALGVWTSNAAAY